MSAPAFLLALGAASLLALACTSAPGSDDEFEALADEYLEMFLRLNPEYATVLGEHRYDDRLGDYSQAGFAEALANEWRFLDRLQAIDRSGLSEVNAIDHDILRNRIEYNIFLLDEVREQEWNPLTYNVGNGIYSVMARDFAPAAERLRSIRGRLEQVPQVIEAAQANLRNSPKPHTDTAILQNRGTISLVRDGLENLLEEAEEMRDELAPAQALAAEALEAYGKWLGEDLLPRSTGDFRLGEEKFRKKLAYELQSALSMEEILARAEQALADVHEELYQTALPLQGKFFPGQRFADRKALIRAVLDRLAEDHPTDETIVEDAKRSLEEVTAFTREQKIVSLPDEPVEIIVMPEFQRGVSIAYCDAPGPLEENGETFYAIAPTPADWTAERSQSFYREYNDYMLHDLTVHEATPGHYLQIAHSNEFAAPTLIRGVFYSNPFVEGWAVYAERLMTERGFGGPEVKMQRLKMLTRAILNAILDQKIHAGSMTEQEAMRLMMEEGFQEEGEAAGKWRRAQLTSAQLSTYFVGYSEVSDIREAWEAQQGPIEDWRAFHDKMLSFGSPPPKYVQQLMQLK